MDRNDSLFKLCSFLIRGELETNTPDELETIGSSRARVHSSARCSAYSFSFPGLGFGTVCNLRMTVLLLLITVLLLLMTVLLLLMTVLLQLRFGALGGGRRPTLCVGAETLLPPEGGSCFYSRIHTRPGLKIGSKNIGSKHLDSFRPCPPQGRGSNCER